MVLMVGSRLESRPAWCPARRRLATGLLGLAAGLLAATGQAATLEVRVVGADGQPVAEAVAWLESPAARSAVPASPPPREIEQKDRQFTQRVTVVPVGTAVEFPNRDKVRHHVYSVSPAKPFELKLYLGKPANPVLFDRSGVAVLGCNIHDEMLAWVVVVPTPYFGLSQADGRIRLEDVPAGPHVLLVWHPDLPTGAAAQSQALRLGPADVALQVQLPVRAY